MTTNDDSAGPLDRNVRAQFEHWFSDDGASPKAVERGSNGEYRYMPAVQAWKAWNAATDHCIRVIEAYRVPVGNSAAGEMACEWTMDALREIRDAMRSNATVQAAAPQAQVACNDGLCASARKEAM